MVRCDQRDSRCLSTVIAIAADADGGEYESGGDGHADPHVEGAQQADQIDGMVRWLA